jgi:hypothetical protein
MNPLQRASMIRKVIYFAAILVLFTVSMVWRGMIPVPLGASTARAAQPLRWAANHTIQSQAQRLEVWEADPNEGEAEVSGSALRLALTGSRGIAVTLLWQAAIEKQKRNDFHEFESLVKAVTKLQPNFITPWIFQSWNITYNISVEMQGSGDMYFYIVRGIQLLAEGERRNKRSPDMRYQIAFYYQNKFGVSDTVETLRCLFDLSCIPPSERNPDALLINPKTKELDRDAFRQFCERHPHFVRRLRGADTVVLDKRAREKLRAPTPEDVIRFLRDNYKDLPCRYRKNALSDDWTDDLADADKQFPALPPQFNEGPDEAHPLIATNEDTAPVVGYFSAYKAARAWFSYSLLLLPPPLKDEQGDPIPGPTPPPGVGGHDPAKHRVPRLPMMIIFRQGAPRAQSYQAELEQKEGWFDSDGWRIPGWFPEREQKGEKVVVVGAGRPWSLIEWQRAAEMWRQHGKDYGLTLSPERYESLRQQAGDMNAPLGANPADDAAARRRYLAREAMRFYVTYRQTTNFPYFLHSAEGEARPATVQARKTLWLAEQAKNNADNDKAIELYKDGLEQWKRVLADNPSFHRLPPPDRGDRVEEETYEYELAYQRLLVQHSEKVRERANEIAHAAHGVVPFLTVPFPSGGLAAGQTIVADPLWPTANRESIKWFVVENVGGEKFSSPFVGTLARDGSPWVREDLKDVVRNRMGVPRRTQPAVPPSGPPPGSGRPGAPPPPPLPGG